jgi:hypothetical protein
MDWTDGSKRQLAQIQAVTTIKYGNKSNCIIGYGSKSICMIGYLGHLTFLTGLNCDGVFAGILDSSTGAVYSSTDKYSYTSDLRYALENSASLDEVANFVTNPSRNYPFNHNVILSDRQTSKVLENNFSGTGTNMQRALRSDTSALNPEITWGFTDAVATVNSFLLYGNHDNHTGNLSNMNRWESLKTQLQNYGETITLDELKLIASFDNDDGPGSQSSGDVYNKGTQQIVLFQPDNFHLEVAFRPKSGILPADPVFETILLVWNHLAYAHTLNMDKIAPITLNDTITISAFVENPKEHEVSALLIFESLDGAIVDSVEMFPVDPALNEPWQCKWITENIPENIYWLSLKVTDITEGTYFTSKNMTRVTNRPLTIGTLSYTKSSDNKYSIKTELKYPGESMKIISPIIKITSDDPWIKSIAPEQVTISGLKPGDMKRIPSSVVSVDEATFPGYVNLTYTISEDGWTLWVIDTITIFFVPTGLEQFESHLSFNLEQNYPNPFNSVTTINWQLAKTSKVTLKVLDILGRTVATLVDEQRPQGKYETRFDAATLPKGIYFCQLKAGENMQTRKMILLD